jgi:condensin complex subunit 1
MLTAIVASRSKSAMPWLWMGDPAAWQQVVEKVSDAGFAVLDFEQAMKHKETRTLGLRCIVEPLLQEGHDHSNLLLATVSKLTHGLRGHELAAPFAADAVAMAHATSLPRSLLTELTQLCTGGNLQSQGALQRSLGCFLSCLAERLPHVTLGNISVLLELLNVDCYPLRSAIVDSIGSLLTAEGRPLPRGARCSARATDAGDDGAEASEAGKDGDQAHGNFRIASTTKVELLETLMARTLDKTVWVRVQTLRTLTSLAQNRKALPREVWPRVLQIAAKRMQDSASSARKAALGLTHALVQLHPYGPSLKGAGDERAKTEQILRYIGDRKQALTNEATAEELAEAEEILEKSKASNSADAEDEEATELPTSQEGPLKRRRLGKKTHAQETTMEYEVDKALAADAEDGESRSDARDRELKKLDEMEQCYADRFKFVELLEEAEVRLRGLLVSRVASDVTEAIGVVVELKKRGLPAAARAFNQILSLVWSRHTNVRDAAVEAFFNMHLEEKNAEQAVYSLLEMYQGGCTVGGWTYTHLASVSELIQQAATQERIDPAGAIRVLARELPGPQCPMVLRTLTALAAADANQLAKVLPQVTQHFGPQGACFAAEPSQRLDRVRLLCQLLQRLLGCVKPPLSPTSADFKQVWTLCQQALHVVIEQFSKGRVVAEWFGAAQAVMDLSFDLAAYASPDSPAGVGCPDKQWEAILEGMLRGVLREISLANRSSTPPVGNGASDSAAASQSREDPHDEADEEMGDHMLVAAAADHAPSEAKAFSSQLSCMIFMLGHFALRMVIYMESTQGLLKKKRMSEEDSRMAAEREKKKNDKPTKKGKKSAAKDATGDDDAKKDEEEASSLGMAGQEEREAEHFAEMIEQRLLYNSKSLLSRARPLLLKGLCDQQQRSNPVVRRAAAISLCKYMTVSKRFCEEHLQLLFSVLFPKARDQSNLLASSAAEAESTARDSATGNTSELLEDLTLRQSLLVAVGDLLFRHPNVVEPWTDRLYNALGAPTGSTAEGIARATDLRLTALLVLTHLVLNDMMKPRAVLLGRALWLTACRHESTSKVARILFQELSKRSNNVIYNLLPEVIARLPEQREGNSISGSTINGNAEERVTWVMQFVEKEKHIEGLIEKLSIRLEQSSDIKGMSKEGFTGVGNSDTAEDTMADCPLPAVAESGALETVSCLAHALGAMTYSDRCMLRLHDVVVIRKALNTAISYHQVVRDCLLGVVEKARKPRVGKVAGEGGAEPEGADAVVGKGGKMDKDSAAAKAIEEIEQVINTLSAKKKDSADTQEPVAVEIPTPQSGGRAELPVLDAKKGKRKKEEVEGETAEAENAGGEDGAAQKRGKGRRRGGEPQAKVESKPAPQSASSAPSDLFASVRPAAPAAPPAKKIASGGEELRAALQAQKAARKGKGKGKRAAASSKVDDDED